MSVEDLVEKKLKRHVMELQELLDAWDLSMEEVAAIVLYTGPLVTPALSAHTCCPEHGLAAFGLVLRCCGDKTVYDRAIHSNSACSALLAGLDISCIAPMPC